MSEAAGRLYDLLPVLYRLRDADRGEPLRALLAVIEREVGAIEADIDRLYDNWFIETCEDWAAPYIGDVLGVRSLHAVTTATLSERARVANTLGYRRRKGTLAMLEQLARDVTDWPARAVEYFQLLDTTQHLNHVRPANVRTPDLRDTRRLELLGTPFETTAHAVEVRGISSGLGRYNIPNVGLFLWRLQSYSVAKADARPVTEPGDGRYHFNPLGLDGPLFNRPRTETAITSLAGEPNVPGALRRRALHDDLEALRRALAEGRTPRSVFFADLPVFQLLVDDESALVPPEEILICDLSDPEVAAPEGWPRPPATKTYTLSDGGFVDRPIRLAVDPALGRLAFPSGIRPDRVRVSFAYGFSGDVGGGPYNRSESAGAALIGTVDWQIGVSKEIPPVPDEVVETLSEAIQAWNAQVGAARAGGLVGVIAIMDSATYQESLNASDQVVVPAGCQLLIVAAGWPETEVPDSPGVVRRVPGHISASGARPHVLGDISMRGSGSAAGRALGVLAINGLLIEGSVNLLAGDLGKLRLSHCTLAAGGGLTSKIAQNERLEVSVDHSILGPISLPSTVPSLVVADTIVSGISAPGSTVDLARSTVVGSASVQVLSASDCIFTGPVTAARRQSGCVRFCFVPDGSATPQRYRCQPDSALAGVTDPAESAVIAGRLVPSFTSLEFGAPAFAQLSVACPAEIGTGAEDGSEMGAFSSLKQPQREANLRASLDEYLRFGLEAGITFVT
jgi:hypothetical protein